MRNFLLIIIGLLQAISCRAASPLIDTLSPPSANPGTGSLSLTIHGANFAPGVIVQVDSQSFTPTFLS
jgi:hypothetical protein